LIGWPLSRSTRAAASSALDFDGAALAALAAAGGDTGSDRDGLLAGVFFFGAGSGEVRFFLAVMGEAARATARIWQRRAVRAAARGKEDYLDRAADSRQLWTKSSRFCAVRLPIMCRSPSVDAAGWHVAVGASAAAARPSRGLPQHAILAATPVRRDRGPVVE